ncbi:MAG: T9SS type A sorting domain-containing protein [Bacteroidetes bacterium]|nr:T9SS type A sorting domain-containing protein [Bacteroidota bacterium]
MKIHSLLQSGVKIAIVLLIISFGLAEVSLSQITITQTSLEQVLQGNFDIESSTSEDSENIAPLLEASGADQTWDFTTLTYDQTLSATGTITFSSNTDGAPLNDDPHLQQASQVVFAEFITDTLSFNIYQYNILNESELTLLGTVMVEEGETDPSSVELFKPGIIEFQLPATFEDTWSYDYTQESSFGGSTSTTEVSVTVEIDAWGKVITDDGEFDVLRLVETETRSSFGFEFSTVSVDYITVNGISVASISGSIDPTTGEFDQQTLTADVTTISGLNTSTDETVAEVPRAVELEQNFPNPFNPSTTIAYQLSESSNVQLSVYSITGEHVATLVNQNQSPGDYTVSFGAEGLASGSYIYRLAANGQVLTRKMTLIK